MAEQDTVQLPTLTFKARQNEEFIINDIELGINPSDVQVMDDNWVMEDSYLRSNAVFCFRSKYAATKVVLNIPFQVTNLNTTNDDSLNNTYNCIKLISQLNSYPFCFIKNQRVRAYVAPTAISKTDYMLFAVDEITLVQDAKASNMMFLEVVLQYFNHVPFCADFNFRSNLNVELVEGNKSPSEDELDGDWNKTGVVEVGIDPVDNLQSSEIWKKYMNPKVNKVIDTLHTSGLIDMLNSQKDTHQAMGVKLLYPLMSVISEDTPNIDDGNLIGKDTKLITVTDLSKYDNGAMENMLMTFSNQDFSSDSVFENRTVATSNSEQTIKEGKLTTSEERKAKAIKNEPTILANGRETANPFDEDYVAPADSKEQLQTTKDAAKKLQEENSLSGSKRVYIQWQGDNIQDLDMGIQTIRITRKNKLASHQISSFKHPIIQYLGKYPLNAQVTMVSTNHNVYETTEDLAINVFIKQSLNILDFNRSNIPEAEAYNYLKIKSLATYLLDCENYVPAQSVVSSSANQQGIENISYSFNESDLSSFIEQSRVIPSGALSIKKAESRLLEMVISWLQTFNKDSSRLFNNANENSGSDIHALKIFRSAVSLAEAAFLEFGFATNDYETVLKDSIELTRSVSIGNNSTLNLNKLNSTEPKYFSKFNCYVKPYITDEELQTVREENGLLKNDRVSGTKSDFSAYHNYKEAETLVLQKQQIEGTTRSGKSVLISTSQYVGDLTSFIISILQLRLSIGKGEKLDIANLAYRSTAVFDNNLLSISALLEAGLFNGEGYTSSLFENEVDKNFLAELNKDYANVFYGYNYEDLNLETLVDNYTRETDILVPKIDPFFFIEEEYHLDGNELYNVFDELITNKMDPSTDITKAAQQTNKNEPDETIIDLGVVCNRLKEVEYLEVKDPSLLTQAIDGIGTVIKSMLGLGDGEKNTFGTLNQNTINYIEAALKALGKSNDAGFRDLVYKFIYAESKNVSGAVSGTGAVGLMQLTNIAIEQVLVNNKGVFTASNGAKITAETFRSNLPNLKERLKTDDFLNVQIGGALLDWILKNKSSQISSGGAVDPVLVYAAYNVGPGTLDDLVRINSGVSVTFKNPSDTRKAIKNQRLDLISNSDVETTQNYLKFAKSKINVNNVPPSVRTDVIQEERMNNYVDPNINNPFSSKKDVQQSTVYTPRFGGSQQKATKYLAKQSNGLNNIPLKQEQEQIVKEIDKYVSDINVTPVKADKSNLEVKGTVIKNGIVTVTNNNGLVEDGDTIFISDPVTNKKYDIRVYGIDAPESEKTNKEGEIWRQGEVLGQKAKEEYAKLVKGKKVTLMLIGKDDKGRDVGKIILPDGTDPALTLLRNGLGTVPANFINDAQYIKAEEEARQNHKGIWSLPEGVYTPPRLRDKKGIPYTQEDLNKIKKGLEYAKFTKHDLEQASKPNGQKFNNFQPVIGGPFQVTSFMQKNRNGRPHEGVDIGCPSGTTVIAAASGRAVFKVMGGYGWTVDIDHGNGFLTRYAHLREVYIPKEGKDVVAGEKIGLSGGRSKKGGASVDDPGRGNSNNKIGHLHYEVRYNNKPINPFGTKLLTDYKPGEMAPTTANATIPNTVIKWSEVPPRSGVTEENTVFNETELAYAIFKNMYKYTNIGLKASLPAIKVFITIGNENDKFWLDTLKTGMQYYELKGIKSFKMNCNNDRNPVDTAIMEVADPSFLYTDAFMGMRKMQGVSMNMIGTDYETQFKNDILLLKPGIKISVRVGFSNDPNELDILFNGAVVDMNITSPQSVLLVCESFGKELLSEVMAPSKPVFLNNQSDNISTSQIIGESLSSPAITHFGYATGFWGNTYKGQQDPEDRKLSNSIFSMDYNLFFDFTKSQYKQRLFMNVFAPEIETVEGLYSEQNVFYRDFMLAFSGNNTQGYPFAIYKMTPWDCLKQMEYRHPNCIAKPLIFEDRQTMFFGIKEQMYFSRDLGRAELNMAAKEKEEGNKEGYSLKNYYNKRRERMSPAVNIHLVSSNHNIISNGLRLNAQYSTVTNVSYYNKQEAEYAAKPWEQESFKMQLDDNLYSWDLREKQLVLSGCLSKMAAFVYGTTDLKKEAEKMYGGKIILLGNPTIKAGDYAFIDDSEKRLHGLILIRECYHIFDDKQGYITEIVPGQYVEAAQFLHSDLWFKIMCCSKVVTSKLKINLASDYNSEDFNMTMDYLTVMNQIMIATDTYDSYKDNWGSLKYMVDNPSETLVYGGASTFALYITHRVSQFLGTPGWKESSKLFGKNGFKFGSGLTRFGITFAREMITGVHYATLLQVRAEASALYVGLGIKEVVDGKVDRAKSIVGSKKYGKWLLENSVKAKTKIQDAWKGGGLLWKVTRPLITGGGKAGFFATKILARGMFIGLTSLAIAGAASVLLDVVALFAIQYMFDKIEESKYTRQPLLFFPLIRHGKPYVAGMAGMVRNQWWDAKKLELSKTIKDVKKASQIIQTNAKITGNDTSFVLSAASVASGTAEFTRRIFSIDESDPNYKNKAPTYITNSDGQQLVVGKNGKVAPSDHKNINGKFGTEEESKSISLNEQLVKENDNKNLLRKESAIQAIEANKDIKLRVPEGE